MSDNYNFLTAIADMKQKLDKAGAGGKYEILTPADLPKHKKLGEIFGVEIIACPFYDNKDTLMVQAGEHNRRCPLGKI